MHMHIRAQVQEVVTAAAKAWQATGFVNYFGLQRFGTGTVPSHVIGKALLKVCVRACVCVCVQAEANQAQANTVQRSPTQPNPTQHSPTKHHHGAMARCSPRAMGDRPIMTVERPPRRRLLLPDQPTTHAS